MPGAKRIITQWETEATLARPCEGLTCAAVVPSTRDSCEGEGFPRKYPPELPTKRFRIFQQRNMCFLLYTSISTLYLYVYYRLNGIIIKFQYCVIQQKRESFSLHNSCLWHQLLRQRPCLSPPSKQPVWQL